jgi:hypothetical protein
MAKQSGLGDQLFVAGYDIGADINSIASLSTPRETLPATGITMSAMARMYGKRDAKAEFISYFNDTASQEHTALKSLPRTDVQVMYLRGTGLGEPGLALVGKQLNYDPTRGDDGSLLFTTNVESSAYGADWGVQLSAGKVSHTTGTTVTSVDLGTGSLAFGWQAYLQVFSLTGTSCTVTIQESSDNGAGDAFAAITGGAFTAATGRGVERLQSSSDTATVERYVRIVTTGTFTECSFAVLFTRNEALRAI